MKKNNFNALVAAATAFMAVASLSAQAQAQAVPAASSAAPNQQGVVYPGRPVDPTPGFGQSGPSGVVPLVVPPANLAVPGTQLPGQLAPPPNPTSSRPANTASGNPAMPPLQGGVGPKGPVKSGPALALDDTSPENISVQVRQLRQRMDEIQRASSANPSAAPRPITRSLPVTQAAGEEPPSVRTAMGMPTNLVFTDSTGAPWPIEFATPGDSSQFDVLLPVAGTSNVQIRPKTPYAYGGLSITLKGNSVPVSVILSAAQKEVDSRVDFRVTQRGPNAIAPMVDRVFIGGSPASDSALISFLDGVPPSGAKEVKTSLRSVKAWLLNDQLYLRTDTTLVSPLWTDSMSSPNGVTRTYLLSNVPSVVVSTDGRMVPVTISE